MEVHRLEIPLRLPSCNEYINACRKNKYVGAKMKRSVEEDMGWYLKRLPKFKNPIEIHFEWIDKRWRVDPDNACFAKKFILDAMVKVGVLPDDNAKWVRGFTDTFGYGSETKVILIIREVEK